jgi:hypothetical protein
LASYLLVQRSADDIQFYLELVQRSADDIQFYLEVIFTLMMLRNYFPKYDP